MNVFVFDIETVPDVANGRRLLELGELDDHSVAEAMFHRRRQQVGHEFLQLHLHQVVAISAVLRSGNAIKVWSLGTAESDEKELIERFFDGIAKFSPTLVSWNGSGFDLPVLHYRALLHGVQAEHYWDMGEVDNQFRWNNYISRYHMRHTDVMDVLAMYNPRANAPLDQVASMLGFPGKMGMSGAKVWESYHQGDVKAIRDYCETDVLNTYLVYLRFQLMRGHLSRATYEQECQLVADTLEQSQEAHMREFLQNWPSRC